MTPSKSRQKPSSYPDFSVLCIRGRLKIAWKKHVHCEPDLYLHTNCKMPDTPQNRATAARIAGMTLMALGVELRHTHDALNYAFQDIAVELRGETRAGKSRTPKVPTVGDMWKQILEKKKLEIGESTYNSKWDGAYTRALAPYALEPLNTDIIKAILSDGTRLNFNDKRVIVNALKAHVFLLTGDSQLVDAFFEYFRDWLKGNREKVSRDEFAVKCYTVEEVSAILDYYTKSLPRDNTFLWTIRLLYALGCRPSELAGLQWRHVDLVAERICICQQFHRDLRKITETKTSKIRYVSLTKESVKLIWELNRVIKPSDTNDYLLPLQSRSEGTQAVSDLWRSPTAGIPHLIDVGIVRDYYPLYSLRHSYITHALERGNSIEAVAYNCGHSVATCRQHYVDNSFATRQKMI